MVLWLQRITLEVPVSQSMFLMSASSLPINDNGTSKKQSKSHQWPKALSKSLQVANGFREVHGLPQQGVPSCGTSTFLWHKYLLMAPVPSNDNGTMTFPSMLGFSNVFFSSLILVLTSASGLKISFLVSIVTRGSERFGFGRLISCSG